MGKKKERIRELELENDALLQDLCKVQADLARTQDELKKHKDPAVAAASKEGKRQIYEEGLSRGRQDAKDDFIYWLGVVLERYPTNGFGLEEMKKEVVGQLDYLRKLKVAAHDAMDALDSLDEDVRYKAMQALERLFP